MENSQSNSNPNFSFSSTDPVTASAPVRSGNLAAEILRIFPFDPPESYVIVPDDEVRKLRELAGA